MKIEETVLLASNPCIELWFLLHYKNKSTLIDTNECIKQLSNRNRNTYKKGIIDDKLKAKFIEKCDNACRRSKQLKLYDNPSSNVYILIEELEKVQKQNKKQI